MISYFVLIIIPLGLLAFISYNQVSRTIESLLLYSAKQNFEQTTSFLNYKISKVIEISDIISVDKNLVEILKKPLENYSYAEQIRDAEDLCSLYLSPYQNDSDIYRVRLYVRDELIYAQERVNLFSIKDIEKTEWYRLLSSRKDKILWCPDYYFPHGPDDSANVVSAARIIRDPAHYNRMIGVFRIDMYEDNLKNIIKNANITQKGAAYLQNADGAIIASSDSQAVKAFDVGLSYCLDISKSGDVWRETIRKGKKLLVGSKNISGTDWVLVSIIPYDEILSTGNAIRDQMIVLLFVLASLAYMLAYYISGSSTKRISHLIKKMRKAQKGDLEIIPLPPAKDEIGELMENFNFMIQKIKVLMEYQYKSGQEIKNAELKALQAQINPHFLYNTLDLINWMAVKCGIPEISSVVRSLSGFYKLSLNKGRDLVPISDEIEHVKLYVNIQNMRFENKIRLGVDIDDEILGHEILKTILQPIVENSIMHGILEKDDKSGNISITGKRINDAIILKVSDDGIGMKEETVAGILDANPGENHGYGVRNINNRLKLYYGQEYGLVFRSEPGAGTEVEIRIPAEKRDGPYSSRPTG